MCLEVTVILPCTWGLYYHSRLRTFFVFVFFFVHSFGTRCSSFLYIHIPARWLERCKILQLEVTCVFGRYITTATAIISIGTHECLSFTPHFVHFCSTRERPSSASWLAPVIAIKKERRRWTDTSFFIPPISDARRAKATVGLIIGPIMNDDDDYKRRWSSLDYSHMRERWSLLVVFYVNFLYTLTPYGRVVQSAFPSYSVPDWLSAHQIR